MSAWTWLLGLDFGIRDNCAATVGGWREHDPIVYIPRSYRFKATPTECAIEVRKLQEEYDFCQTVGDTGGMGLAFAAEMASRFQISIVPAKKADKLGAIRLFNGDLRCGRIKVVRAGCLDLLEEWRDLPWAEHGMREAEGYKADASDSALYMWKAARAYHEAPEPPPPTQGEAYRQMERDIIDQREAAVESENSLEWWHG
ncbi:MAG: hypothetical protein NVS2B6_17160 [Thermoleophilaceae bacterium]